MKSILVFRTCSDEVIDQLFREIGTRECRIYCLVQPGCLERYQSRYKDIVFINSGMEVFCYEKMNLEMLQNIRFYDIYVPSSSPYFRNYEDVFFIIDQLQYKTLVLYDCYGNKRCYKYKNQKQKRMQYIISKLLFRIFSGAYKLKYKFRSNE